MRIGHGYDVHQLAQGRKLILGGVQIPFEKGLLGHSDADVLIHAICDAILGALGLGDIGQHFPDSDDSYKEIDSRILLRDVARKMLNSGYRINNIDATIIAQKPKLADYLAQMKSNIAQDINQCLERQVNIKATTTEKLGPMGRQEGIAAHAVVLLSQRQDLGE